MPSTFMDLTNSLLRRINEPEISQSDFLSVIGVQAAAKDAINSSINTINEDETAWDFTHVNGSQLLVVGTEQYAWPTDFKLANWDSFYIIKDDSLSVNTTTLIEINYTEWVKRFLENDLNSGTDGLSPPKYVFRTKSGGFGVTPSPEQAYTVNFEYYSLPTLLSAYDDETRIPTIHNEVIMQGGLYHAYMFRNNVDQARLAESKFKKHLAALRKIYNKHPDHVENAMAVRRGV